MAFLFILLTINNSIWLCFTNTPILMMMIILFQAILICLTVKSMISISWFSFILFLVFIGGLMILFIYIVSLASNSNLTISHNKFLLTSLIIISIFIFSWMILNEKNFNLSKTVFLEVNQWLFKMYSNLSAHTITLVMLYLLLTLLITVSIILKKSGPLRSIYLNKQ
uniref:NADH-ubiquinone oxidoreductase chain 6 n=1 Tax=Friesea propria TaxID=2785902 RepID=B5KY20_9HEXA|nr:NADH dehydrogenase subunit 6 [Friesea propria]ABV02151.1 NADH dehydrogenase subunit 6 [Friesea propria]